MSSQGLHWTYQSVDANSDLAQGDILGRSDKLEWLLSEAHKHFLDGKYLGFVVITQTCDLVRRSQQCKTHYITLAAVRSLNTVLDRLFEEYGTQFDEIFVKDKQHLAMQLVERILNQNEQSHGLFYLHPDADAGVAEHSVAMLRVTISVRAEHYEILLNARRGRIDGEFSNKLGWLVGNLYSRIGTRDWADDLEGQTEFKNLREDLLTKGKRRQWIAESWVKKAVSEKLHTLGLSTSEAIRKIEEIAPKSKKQMALDRIRSIALDVLGVDYSSKVELLVRSLDNDQDFSAACPKK